MTNHFTNNCTNNPPVLALKSDKKEILRFYKNNRYSARFIGGDRCYLIRVGNTIIASVIISSGQNTQPSGDSEKTQYLLHALLITPAYRKQGLASTLIKRALSEELQLVCFAEATLSQLYLNNGFSHINEAEIEKYLRPNLLSRFLKYSQKQPQLKAFSCDTLARIGL